MIVPNLDTMSYEDLKTLGKERGRGGDGVFRKVCELKATAVRMAAGGDARAADFQQLFEEAKMSLPEEQRWW